MKNSKLRKINEKLAMTSQFDLAGFYDVIMHNSVFQLGFLTREFQIPSKATVKELIDTTLNTLSTNNWYFLTVNSTFPEIGIFGSFIKQGTPVSCSTSSADIGSHNS